MHYVKVVARELTLWVNEPYRGFLSLIRINMNYRYRRRIKPTIKTN